MSLNLLRTTGFFALLYSTVGAQLPPVPTGTVQIRVEIFASGLPVEVDAFNQAGPTDLGNLDGQVLKVVAAVDGDFNDDGSHDCSDVDALVATIASGSHENLFDLTNDGLVDDADLAAWLVEGGAANAAETGGNPFLDGDANLDGTVDGADFITWNNFKFTSTPAWCRGDFTADGMVDGGDFIVWNANKFTSSDQPSSAVPEPVSSLWLVVFGCGGLTRRREATAGQLGKE